MFVNAEAEVSWTIFSGFAFRWRRRKGKLEKAWAADDFVSEITLPRQLSTLPH